MEHSRLGHFTLAPERWPQQLLESIRLESLARQEGVDQAIELDPMILDAPFGFALSVHDQLPHLILDLAHRHIARAAVRGEPLAEERVLHPVLVKHWPNLIAHAKMCDHLEGDLRGLLEVVGGARRYAAEHDALGSEPAEQHRQARLELGLRLEMPILR